MTKCGHEALKLARAAGRIKLPKGSANKRWLGGPKAARERAQADGRLAQNVRNYRAKNPHKSREWSQTRKGRKTGRLPRGTIPRLYEEQNALCVLCRVSLETGYHMDHIFPLSKGGKHVAENIQLLCPTCNVRKSAKLPSGVEINKELL